MLPKKLSTGFRYTATSAFDNKVTIQSLSTTADDLGGLSTQTVFAANIYASVRPLQGRELYKAQQLVAEVTHKVVIRYRVGVKSNMTVLFDGRVFDIQYVMDPDEQKVELWLFCLERSDGSVPNG
jgi:SPP1 family predicted phage head-tail adaptor